MDIVRWDPFREMDQLFDRYNRVFRMPSLREEGKKEGLTAPEWHPSVDVTESDTEYLIKAEIPEVKKEDVKVSVHERILSISGERKQEKEEKGKKFHRIERSYGSFLRSFTLPMDVDETRVTAECKDGMLYVHVPKAEKAKSKAIDVKVG
jgi:HSP20 family protein